MSDAGWHRVVQKRRVSAALLQCSPKGVEAVLLAYNTVAITITCAGASASGPPCRCLRCPVREFRRPPGRCYQELHGCTNRRGALKPTEVGRLHTDMICSD